jgi:hypothetical protein
MPSASGKVRVPLGAQSIVQAGDPAPGEVRYLPVPMVTVPDIRRAPTNATQMSSTSGNAPATSDPAHINAFTPASSRQVVAQTNAFGAGGTTLPAMSPGRAAPASNSAGMMAQAARPVGSTNPTNPSVIPAGFQGAASYNQNAAVSYRSLAFPSPAAAPSTPDNIRRMESGLRDSLYPSQREWAAENLATVDWRMHPQVVQTLLTAAKEDPAATVRATCVRSLANMKANTAPVITMVRSLTSDTDPRVRKEAERAVSVLGAGQK